MARQEERARLKQLQGQGKELVGIFTGDSALELEGDQQQTEGKAEESRAVARREAGERAAGAKASRARASRATKL